MKATKPPRSPGRKEQRTPARRQDAFRDTAKGSTATCPRCGAAYRAGRWTWAAAPADAAIRTCPACLRIEQRQPAGFLSLTGPFFVAHREEILRVVSSHEAREREAHPMQRLIAIEDQPGGAMVTTTDPHLARGLAVALHDAYKGELELQLVSGGDAVRARWSR